VAALLQQAGDVYFLFDLPFFMAAVWTHAFDKMP
jgi:hypothetical protein